MAIIGSCDVCERNGIPLYRGVVCGIETFYCGMCAGDEPDAYGDEAEEE